MAEILVAMSAVGSDDPTLTVACGVVAALAVGLLWRLGEPPALLMVAGLQLLQVVTPLLYANFLGVPLQSLFDLGDLSSATEFALAAMLSLVVGIRCGQWGTTARASGSRDVAGRWFTVRFWENMRGQIRENFSNTRQAAFCSAGENRVHAFNDD